MIAPPAFDPDLPAAQGLFEREGEHFVGSFLGERGWEMQEVKPVQALYRPGSSCIARYRVRALNPEGQEKYLTICAETRLEPREPKAPEIDFEQRYGLAEPVEVRSPYLLWAFPYDPGLRGLIDAAWGPDAREEIARIAHRPSAVEVQTLRYRPRRRAVLRYKNIYTRRSRKGREIIYGKVLRSSKADRAMEIAQVMKEKRRRFGRKSRLELLLPLGRIGNNTLLYDPSPGRTLRDLLFTDERLPDPTRIARISHDLDALTAHRTLPEQVKQSSPAEIARFTAVLLNKLVPEARDEISHVVDATLAGHEVDAVEPRTVHGDLYESQIFVKDDFSLGLIDLDDLGPGDPAMDAANLCAHLLVSALSTQDARSRLLAYRAVVREAFIEELNISPRALTWREALILLQLATGPFRVMNPRWPSQVRKRITLATRVLDAA